VSMIVGVFDSLLLFLRELKRWKISILLARCFYCFAFVKKQKVKIGYKMLL
jgi:hypothetical protein